MTVTNYAQWPMVLQNPDIGLMPLAAIWCTTEFYIPSSARGQHGQYMAAIEAELSESVWVQ